MANNWTLGKFSLRRNGALWLGLVLLLIILGVWFFSCPRSSTAEIQQSGGAPYPQTFEPTPSLLAQLATPPANLPIESQPYYAQYIDYLADNHTNPLTYQQWLPEWMNYIASGQANITPFTQWREAENRRQFDAYKAAHPDQTTLTFENWLSIKYGTNPQVAADIIAAAEATAVCRTDSDCNIVYGQGQNRCEAGRCRCRVGGGQRCELLPTYYKDPRTMTPIEVIRFKRDAKLENMTPQDYKNWLLLFTPDPMDLPLLHRKNLYRVQRGEPVTIPTQVAVDEAQARYEQEVPSSRPPCGATVQAQNGHSLSQLLKGGDGAFYLKLPQVEADSANNFRFQDNHLDTSGYASDSSTPDPLQWAMFQPGADIDQRYIKFTDKLKPFKTTPIGSWFTANQGLSLADIYGDTSFDPAFNTTYRDWDTC